ncbi:MAG: FtsX-like permease family protein [Spirochaetaceae bacterium]|jgi:ABC-type lipoprotein release transport system permease subunit|nr:FtsX-like permease family protein [Spirochaetaceae bacterium]
MRIADAWTLAGRYVVSCRRRYIFLFCALVLGFCVIGVISSQKDGMAESVYDSARNHYSGDIIVTGFDAESESGTHIYAETVPRILQKIDETGIRPDKESLRTLQFSDSLLHYNGNAAPLKYLVGVDWPVEADYFDGLNFTEGAAPPGSDDDALLLSAPIAAYLGVRAGDMVLVETETMYGQKNTAFFTVSGVIDDRSLFGYYKSFVSRRALNGLIGFGQDDCSTIGLFFDSRAGLERKRERLQQALEGVVPLRPLVYDRESFDREKDWEWNGVMFFLLTVPVYVSDVAKILQALNIIAYFLYAMMLLIIMVSAGVTYRLILHERMKEIGTMRAIGCYGNDIRRLLLYEAAILATLSLVTGFFVTLFINWVISRLQFSWFPGFEIFLRNGQLLALYGPAAIAINVAAVYIILFIAVYAPSLKFSRDPLPDLLSGIY